MYRGDPNPSWASEEPQQASPSPSEFDNAVQGFETAKTALEDALPDSNSVAQKIKRLFSRNPEGAEQSSKLHKKLHAHSRRFLEECGQLITQRKQLAEPDIAALDEAKQQLVSAQEIAAQTTKGRMHREAKRKVRRLTSSVKNLQKKVDKHVEHINKISSTVTQTKNVVKNPTDKNALEDYIKNVKKISEFKGRKKLLSGALRLAGLATLAAATLTTGGLALGVAAVAASMYYGGRKIGLGSSQSAKQRAKLVQSTVDKINADKPAGTCADSGADEVKAEQQQATEQHGEPRGSITTDPARDSSQTAPPSWLSEEGDSPKQEQEQQQDPEQPAWLTSNP